MNQNELQRVFEQFPHKRVLIIGDVMIDSYVWGKVDRISPEAPVPVVAVKQKEDRLGGAANVALNIKALGATPVLASVIGNDRGGDSFLRLLESEGLTSEGIVRFPRQTTVKTRIIGNNHQLLRVDEEDDSLLAAREQDLFLNHVLKLINDSSIDVIIFEDYDKGVISENLIKEVVLHANQKNILTAVDPKKRNFQFYKGVYLFKPNLKEIREGLASEVNPKSLESLSNIDSELRKLLHHTWSLITLSEYGMFASNGTEHVQIASRPVTISDVSGAGDTVISTAALCLASGADIQLSIFLANLAGGSVCEKPGVVPVDATTLFTDAIAELKKLPE